MTLYRYIIGSCTDWIDGTSIARSVHLTLEHRSDGLSLIPKVVDRLTRLVIEPYRLVPLLFD